MKIVVTGGAGFIGSNLVDTLIEQGHSVTVVDDLSTGKIENINSKAVFCKIDVTAKGSVEELQKIFTGASVLFHVAALPRVEPSINDPRESHRINIDGTLNVFWAAKLAGIKQIVFSSSSSVYGDAQNFPTTEEEPVSPMSPYALQKLVNEQYAKMFCNLYDMDISCLRYFNVYGHREPTEGAYVPVIGIWLKQHAQGRSLSITGDGTQSRDFVNVTDVVGANIACARSGLKGFNVFNVGSGTPYNLNYLSRLISDKIEYIPARIEPKYTKASIKLLFEKTGWRPTVSLEKYLLNKMSK